jgi:nucleotide-binding universal stress UspA family protein
MVSGPDAVGIDVVRLQAELEAQAQAKLDTVVTAEDRDQLGTIAVVGIAQSPALEIVRYARAADIDLMIVGTHGRGFVAHLLMGNVAEKVVRLAPCPVLTVHHPEHDFIAPDALQAVARQ